ncbi:hypothetical protein B0O80DRAFT_250418 [Mortierella sp. GBAus27b]|nr:hypothetical protein B0O80DRAFT_250418 [Mortierella sp. GBAus27b]
MQIRTMVKSCEALDYILTCRQSIFFHSHHRVDQWEGWRRRIRRWIEATITFRTNAVGGWMGHGWIACGSQRWMHCCPVPEKSTFFFSRPICSPPSPSSTTGACFPSPFLLPLSLSALDMATDHITSVITHHSHHHRQIELTLIHSKRLAVQPVDTGCLANLNKASACFVSSPLLRLGFPCRLLRRLPTPLVAEYLDLFLFGIPVSYLIVLTAVNQHKGPSQYPVNEQQTSSVPKTPHRSPKPVQLTLKGTLVPVTCHRGLPAYG